MTYFQEVRCKDGTILSVDKLVLDIEFMPGYIYQTKQTFDEYFLMYLQFQKSFEYHRWSSSKIGSYDMNFSIKTSGDNSFYFGLGFVSSDGLEKKRARLEFNPNKVGFHPVFINFFNKLLGLIGKPKIKRFDLAIDYPINRKNAYLIKDRRTYKEVRNSFEDRTQYLGSHNKHGFIKLYNKSLEQKLSIALTRLEITVDNDKSNFVDLKTIFPVVRYFDEIQLKFDNFENGENVKISNTDRFILLSVLQNPDMISLLGKDKRKKIEKIIDSYSKVLTIDWKDYNTLLNRMQFFRNRIQIPEEFLNVHGELSEKASPEWVHKAVFMDVEPFYK